MFDFFKKKSYTVTQENGMKKIIAKKYSKETFDEYITKLTEKKEMLDKIIGGLNSVKELYAIVDKIPESMKDKIKISVDYNFKSEDNLIKAFNDFDIKALGDAVKEAKDVKDDAKEVSKSKEEPKKEEPKKEEKSNEAINDILNLGGDIKDEKNEANVKKDSIVKVAADTNPASSKYRAEGIKEKLLEINKEVAVKSDNKVQNIGNNTKGIITPGDKGTIVKVKEETVKPDIVVENVKIKIIRDDGEFEKLFPEKNIKFPTGDKVVIKASDNNVEIDTAVLQTKSKEIKDKVAKAVEKGNPAEIEQVVNETGVGKTGTASIYDQVMNTVFNRSAEADTEDTNKFEEEVKKDLSLLNNKE